MRGRTDTGLAFDDNQIRGTRRSRNGTWLRATSSARHGLDRGIRTSTSTCHPTVRRRYKPVQTIASKARTLFLTIAGHRSRQSGGRVPSSATVSKVRGGRKTSALGGRLECWYARDGCGYFKVTTAPNTRSNRQTLARINLNFGRTGPRIGINTSTRRVNCRRRARSLPVQHFHADRDKR